jgi:hypothetical protein
MNKEDVQAAAEKLPSLLAERRALRIRQTALHRELEKLRPLVETAHRASQILEGRGPSVWTAANQAAFERGLNRLLRPPKPDALPPNPNNGENE